MIPSEAPPPTPSDAPTPNGWKLATGNEICYVVCAGTVGQCIPGALAAVNTADKALFVTEKAIEGTGIVISSSVGIINTVTVDYRPYVDIAISPGNAINTIVYSQNSAGNCDDGTQFTRRRICCCGDISFCPVE